MRKRKSGENILKLHVTKMIKKQSVQRVKKKERVGRTFVQKPHDTYVTGYGVG